MRGTYLIRNLCISLKEEDSKEQSNKNQEAKKSDVVLPSLGLLAIPATGCCTLDQLQINLCRNTAWQLLAWHAAP